MKYFRILADNQKHGNRWFLDEASRGGETIDPRSFTEARLYSGPNPQTVSIQQKGQMVQFNLAAFDMPVVSDLVWKCIKPLVGADAQFFSVMIAPRLKGFGILNVISAAKCVDEQRTDVQRWEPDDERPELVGQYLGLTNIIIDPKRTGGKHLFRIQGWEIALIASEKFREKLMGVPDLGVAFEPVT